jgi:hypothetical protein
MMVDAGFRGTFSGKKRVPKACRTSELDSKEEKVMIDSIVLMLALGRCSGGRLRPFEREICVGQSRRAANRCSPFAGRCRLES